MSAKPLRDISTDTGHQLLNKLAVKYSFPQYVLSASEDDFQTEGNQSKCAQLLPDARLPTHTKAATWLSYACFVEQRNELPVDERDKIAAFLTKRAEFWDISSDVDAIEKTESQLAKMAAERLDAYPVRSQKEAAVADRWLEAVLADASNKSIGAVDRIDLARKIATFIVPSQLVKAATCDVGCCSSKKVAAKLRDYNKDKNNPVVEKLASIVDGYSPEQMQGAQGYVAVALSHVTDIARPELFLKVSTLEPVTYLANGAVVETLRFTGIDSAALHAADVESGKTAQLQYSANLASRVAKDMSPELADMFCDDLVKAGVAFEVQPRRQSRQALVSPIA